jgi:hypothetical protein
MSLNIGEKVIIEPVNTAENQGSVGKCVAMAICEFLENEIFQITGERIELSYDFIYANRKPTDYQTEKLFTEQAFKNIAEGGICLESVFKVDNVKYPEIKKYFDAIPKEIRESAKKYALNFEVDYYKTSNALDLAIEQLRNKHMLLVSVGSMGHEMCLRGVERLGENEYKYIFRNSWGGNGVYEIVDDKVFLFNNTTHFMKLLNPGILTNNKADENTNEEKDMTVKMQVYNPFYSIDGKKYRLQGTNDNGVVVDTPPIIIDNRTYVPLRAIAEAFGLNVEWVQESKEIIINN